MTTYTDIPTTDTDVDSPVTQSLMERLVNNPLAIQEGDVTAPRIAHKALANVTAGTVINGSNLTNHYAYETTTGIISTSVGTLYGSTAFIANSFREAESWTATYAGVYRIEFTLFDNYTFLSTAGQVYKNGVAFGTLQSITSGTTTFSEDLTFAAGDRIEIWVNFRNASATQASNALVGISDIKIMNAENWGSGR